MPSGDLLLQQQLIVSGGPAGGVDDDNEGVIECSAEAEDLDLLIPLGAPQHEQADATCVGVLFLRWCGLTEMKCYKSNKTHNQNGESESGWQRQGRRESY